jgi:hypothetical protein
MMAKMFMIFLDSFCCYVHGASSSPAPEMQGVKRGHHHE